MAADCLFCQIVSGEVEAEIVLDEELVVGFLDTRPVFKGHTLLVPRTHLETFLDVPESLMTPFFTTAQRVAAVMTSALGAQGTFVAMNNVVSQSVQHWHLHVVPRTKGDGLRGFFWPRTKYKTGEAADYGRRIRDALA